MKSRIKSLAVPAVLAIVLALLLSVSLIGCSPADSTDADTTGSTEGSAEGTGDAAGTNLANDPALLAEELVIEDLVVGTGAEAKTGDTVSVHYTGWLTDGTEFDSSVGGNPYEFTIGAGRVIAGWDQGVGGMKVGGTRKLTIPPSMGYADAAVGIIPAGSTLIFEIELLGIK